MLVSQETPVAYLKNALVLRNEIVEVLENVNIQVRAHEFCYLIGSTGSGKSSLLKVLYGEIPLHEGEGHVCGFDLVSLQRKQVPMLRRKLGIVFQDFQLLFDRSVLDNLRFVLKATGWKDKEKMDARCHEVLQQVGLPTKDYKMPHELSGGEQQRVAIARALLNDPMLILADEPTGNLDPNKSDEIMELLHQICAQGTAVLMATHDYRIINKFPGSVYKVENRKVEKTELF
jgi:cell division transport system ATP-binding protein